MFQMRGPIRTPPFLPEDEAEMLARPAESPMPEPPSTPLSGMPPPPGPPELPVGPPMRQSRPMPPPPETIPPDPTMTTARPDIPPDPARMRWQDDEDLYRSIQGQRPKAEKPGIWNRIAGAAMGGLGGYLASSPRAGAQATGQRAMGLVPEILNPGHQKRMQEWSQDLDMAKSRADRSKGIVKQEEDIKEGESNRKYKEGQGEYYKALPGIRSEQAAATKSTKMVTITPDVAKELGYDEDRIGDEISVAQYTADKKQKGFRDHDTAKMSELEKKLKASEDREKEVTKRLTDLEKMKGDTKKATTQITADSKVKAAGIAANKAHPVKPLPKGVKRGDKTYVAYMDSDGDTVVTEHEMGSSEGKNYLAELFGKTPTSPPAPAPPKAGEPTPPKAAVKANEGPKPEGRIRIRVKATNKTGSINASEFNPKLHEKI